MAGKSAAQDSATVDADGTGNARDERRPQALWIGEGKKRLDMGFGRGPRTLEPHELVSWFFSRDGH